MFSDILIWGRVVKTHFFFVKKIVEITVPFRSLIPLALFPIISLEESLNFLPKVYDTMLI